MTTARSLVALGIVVALAVVSVVHSTTAPVHSMAAGRDPTAVSPANSPPFVNYSYFPGSGDTTTVFHFWAKVSDFEDPVDAIEVQWDWESDGTWDTSWSTDKNATHQFSSPGTYSVLLEARDTGGLTGDRSYEIPVTNPPPPPPPILEVTIAATPIEGELPLTVAFSSQVSGGTPPYQYRWTLGDGSITPATDPVHIYVTSGNFTVWLIVDDSGFDTTHQDVLSNILFINVTPALVNLSVVPSVSPAAAGGDGSLAFASSVAGGTPPYAYRWDFGDGTTSQEASPQHTYPSPGTYLVTLTVTDSEARSTTARFSVTITGSVGNSGSYWLWAGFGFLGGLAVGTSSIIALRRLRRPRTRS